ncbi:unnamed protein product [Polarella glacialis]|uniref:Uncharacterized protein n=1 Tax=Polarella glacialis TaxID=89957 RepID=A0A813IFA6_POLGL|nr:unnamed protein product [Polarella glacialis]
MSKASKRSIWRRLVYAAALGAGADLLCGSYPSTCLVAPSTCFAQHVMQQRPEGCYLAVGPAKEAKLIGRNAAGRLTRTKTVMESGSPLESLVKLLWDEKDPAKARGILEAGDVDLSARFNGKTALHYAALDGHVELVRDIVSKGAAIDAMDEQRGTEGMTPLLWAAMIGHAEVCKALVELGADTSLTEKSGLTALELARAYDRDAVVAALELCQ